MHPPERGEEPIPAATAPGAALKIAFASVGAELLGTELLSAILERHGHEVRQFFDPSLFDDRAIFSMPRLHRLLDVREQTLRELVAFAPDLVAFSVLTNTSRWAQEMATAVKDRLGVPVVFGGVHPTVVPEVVIRHPAVDLLNVGEGFESLPELVATLARGGDPGAVANLWVKRGAEVVRNPVRPVLADLDSLPFPDKSGFEDYYDIGSLYLTITGLGCPYRCTFCSSDVFLDMYRGRGRFLRRRSVAHVIAELVAAKRRYRLRLVKFADDIFTLHPRWLEEFAAEYRRRIGVPYVALSHPRHITERSARLLKESGCHKLEIGVQSVNEETKRTVLDRRETKDDMARAFTLLERFGVPYMLNHMFGIPGEGRAQQQEASRFYADFRPVRIGGYYLKYLPGTRINAIAVERGVITPADVERFQEGYFATVHSHELLAPELRRVCTAHETLNLTMSLLPRWLNRRLAWSPRLLLLSWLPGVVRTGIDVLSSVVHRDRETWAFARGYLSLVARVGLFKLGLGRLPGSRVGRGGQRLAVADAGGEGRVDPQPPRPEPPG